MKKLLLSILAIFLVIGLVGAGTFAWFQDTETSTGNTFTAGTLDLKMEDPGTGYWVDGVSGTWTLLGMKPNSAEVYGKIELGSFGTLTGDHLEIWCTYTVNDDPDVESDTDKETYCYPERFARYMEITLMVYTNDNWWFDLLTGQKYLGSYPNTSNPDGVQAKWRVDDQESPGQPGYGVISLYDLNQDPIDDLPPPDGGNTQFKMRLKLHSSADNGIQGDTLNLTMIFTLNQDSSQ